jgi:hypothetical protein
MKNVKNILKCLLLSGYCLHCGNIDALFLHCAILSSYQFMKLHELNFLQAINCLKKTSLWENFFKRMYLVKCGRYLLTV